MMSMWTAVRGVLSFVVSPVRLCVVPRCAVECVDVALTRPRARSSRDRLLRARACDACDSDFVLAVAALQGPLRSATAHWAARADDPEAATLPPAADAEVGIALSANLGGPRRARCSHSCSPPAGWLRSHNAPSAARPVATARRPTRECQASVAASSKTHHSAARA